MRIISYNKINEKNQIKLFDEENSGESVVEVSDEFFNEIFNEKPQSWKIDGENIVPDEVQIRINELESKLDEAKEIVIQAMEYKLDDEEIPEELQAILDQRKEWQKELDDIIN